MKIKIIKHYLQPDFFFKKHEMGVESLLPYIRTNRNRPYLYPHGATLNQVTNKVENVLCTKRRSRAGGLALTGRVGKSLELG